MNSSLINFHKNRFKWANKAKNDFINRFVQQDATNTVPFNARIQNLNINETSFKYLSRWYKNAREQYKKELEKLEKQIKLYEILIKRQTSIIDLEREEAKLQDGQISSEIKIYDDFLKKIEYKNPDPDDIWNLIDDIIQFTPNNRKASVINYDISRLQQSVEKDICTSLANIKQEANNLKTGLGELLELPQASSIPVIEQKLDVFWFKHTYEKALDHSRCQAFDWIIEMYQNYNNQLTSILNDVIEQKEKLIKDAADLKYEYINKIRNLEKELAMYQKEKAGLDADYQKLYQSWNKHCEEITDLQGFFIKYWLEYKEELQQHFLYGHGQERYLAAQYLQLLIQDAEKLIEPLNN